MKKILFLFCLIFISTSCIKNDIILNSEVEHLALAEILEFLPIAEFNDNQFAVFRNHAHKKLKFKLSIDEKVLLLNTHGKEYSANRILMSYIDEASSFNPLSFHLEASSKYFNETEYFEYINCLSSSLIGSTIKLTIVPKGNSFPTVLNEETTFLGETFTEVYFNSLIEENEVDRTKLFFKPGSGIIAIVDNENKMWVLDRYE